MNPVPMGELVDGPVWTSARVGAPVTERVCSGIRPQIVVDLDTGRGVLVGPRTTSAIVRSAPRSTGIRLTGAGLFAIVGPDIGDLVDSAIDLRDLLPARRIARFEDSAFDVGVLAEELCSTFVPDRRVVLAERALRRGMSARAVTRNSGMDRRIFVPLFRRHLGVTPKTYERLIRFSRALGDLRGPGPQTIADIAVANGFADQAHLTREIRELSGFTPGQLARMPSGPVNHLPNDGSGY